MSKGVVRICGIEKCVEVPDDGTRWEVYRHGWRLPNCRARDFRVGDLIACISEEDGIGELRIIYKCERVTA